ncbi:uncharacterized protein LOC117789019 [Drosophila innubila]|uniref:uncharacterized protein LOC117789019 n=1 Tax=Drosophila innubila TaxID=198719 RepID=UPI00148CCE3E|nr:uncharacterized protein LOC117789019 [Drosophila innubila]
MRTLHILLILALLILGISGAPAPAPERNRRQIDLTLSADHNDKDKETELALEAIAGLWSSTDNRTKIDGSARVVHRASSGMQTGSEQDWRLGVRIVFT